MVVIGIKIGTADEKNAVNLVEKLRNKLEFIDRRKENRNSAGVDNSVDIVVRNVIKLWHAVTSRFVFDVDSNNGRERRVVHATCTPKEARVLTYIKAFSENALGKTAN